jgi:hypothetical protein
MPTMHPYPPLRHPPTCLEQTLSIVHPGPDTIQVAPSRGIGAIFPNLKSGRELKPLHKHYTNFEMWPRALGEFTRHEYMYTRA